jgi:DHA1 family multidrug resistance protein-like MFS transporter
MDHKSITDNYIIMATETANQVDLKTASHRSSIDESRTKQREKSVDDLSTSNEALGEIEKDPENALPSISNENPEFIDFDGPDDPENPKNWTTKRRWAITLSMGSLVFTVTFASSIFSVNIGVVKELFDVSTVTSTLGVALFVLVRSTCPLLPSELIAKTT